MKLCNRLLMLCFVEIWNFCEKWQVRVPEPHFGEVRLGWRTTLVGGTLKTHSRLSIHVNWTFFAIYYGSGVEAKCIQLGCFHRGRPLCIEILSGQGRPPSIILGVRKLETLGYPTSKAASICVPSFSHNTGVWRTDRRADGFAVAIYSACIG